MTGESGDGDGGDLLIDETSTAGLANDDSVDLLNVEEIVTVVVGGGGPRVDDLAACICKGGGGSGGRGCAGCFVVDTGGGDNGIRGDDGFANSFEFRREFRCC